MKKELAEALLVRDGVKLQGAQGPQDEGGEEIWSRKALKGELVEALLVDKRNGEEEHGQEMQRKEAVAARLRKW
jgi:hypothetical protein